MTAAPARRQHQVRVHYSAWPGEHSPRLGYQRQGGLTRAGALALAADLVGQEYAGRRIVAATVWNGLARLEGHPVRRFRLAPGA